MKTQIYFYTSNAYNAVVFKQSEKFYFLTENEEINLYADDAVNQLRTLYAQRIADGDMDISSLCNSNCVFAGNFTADDDSEEAVLIAEYDDEDYTPYIENLLST